MTSPAPPLSELDPTPLGNLYPKPGLVAFTIVVIVISILAIILRFWARYLSAGLRFAYAIPASSAERSETDSIADGMTGWLPARW